ncbi:MAG: hypothetical protein H7X95_11260 [Deltaproteobacteria bacterium]|nr:hypothetical protein [Deltaproteobacteria bacterium]
MRQSAVRWWLVMGWPVLTVMWLWGCGGDPLGPLAQTSPQVAEARKLVDALARGDWDAVAARLDASMHAADLPGDLPGDLPEKLRQMAAFFPKGAPTRVRVVGFDQSRVSMVGGTTTDNCMIMFEFNYSDANVLAQVVFQRVDAGEWRTIGLHANPVPTPLEVFNAFTLRGKGPVHYLFLLIMLAVAAVTVAATVVWVQRYRSIRRRWWWLLGILVGTFKITLNWTTGGLMVQALTVQVLSLGFWRPGIDGPLSLVFSIPAGAIVFLLVQRQARMKARAPFQSEHAE